jgi:hypothetical protein
VLSRILPTAGLVLEIASGSGEHAVYLAGALPNLNWQPSDPDVAALASIEGHRAVAGIPNLKPAMSLDATAPAWPIDAADALVAINMVHIAPWSACRGLMDGACRILPPGGLLYLYGPFMRDGAHTAPGNARFDADLRATNPAWGVRSLEDVIACARNHGLHLTETVPMPANNLSVVFHKSAG